MLSEEHDRIRLEHACERFRGHLRDVGIVGARQEQARDRLKPVRVAEQPEPLRRVAADAASGLEPGEEDLLAALIPEIAERDIGMRSWTVRVVLHHLREDRKDPLVPETAENVRGVAPNVGMRIGLRHLDDPREKLRLVAPFDREHRTPTDLVVGA